MGKLDSRGTGFGNDGTNTIVWIGEPTTLWRYPKVRVSEVQATFGGTTVDNWKSGWNISLEPNAFSGMVNRTVDNVLPVSSGSSIWVKNNDNISYLQPSGKVGIGTANPTAELTVNGHIHAKEVRVYTAAGADFVFDPDYKPIEIDQLEKFVQQNRHLPDIPSEREMIDEGLHLGDMNIKLLQKVEELTLYIIKMNKQLENLEDQNDILQEEVEALKGQ